MIACLEQIMMLFGLRVSRKLEEELKGAVGVLGKRHRCANYSQLGEKSARLLLYVPTLVLCVCVCVVGC